MTRVELEKLPLVFQRSETAISPMESQGEDLCQKPYSRRDILHQQINAKTSKRTAECRGGSLLGNLGIQLSNLRERVPPFSLRRRQ